MGFLLSESMWRYLPLILWISGIFYLSSNKGSVTNTSRFLSPIFRTLFPTKEIESLQRYHLVFRKLCHFFGYAILAFCAILAFNDLPNWHITAFLTTLVVASADEIKQSFYSNRDGSVADVVLDCLGGLAAILLYSLVY